MGRLRCSLGNDSIIFDVVFITQLDSQTSEQNSSYPRTLQLKVECESYDTRCTTKTMSATNQPLDALMPSGAKTVHETSYWSSWGVFWVVILTVVIFFIAVQCWSWRCTNVDDCKDKDNCKIKKNKKPCVDKTPYAVIAIVALLLAILIVWAASYLWAR